MQRIYEIIYEITDYFWFFDVPVSVSVELKVTAVGRESALDVCHCCPVELHATTTHATLNAPC